MPRDPFAVIGTPASPKTLRRRGPDALTTDEKKRAKLLRDRQPPWSFAKIAAELGHSAHDVRFALGRTRSALPDPVSFMVNTKPCHRAPFEALALPGAPAHATFGRILKFVADMRLKGFSLPE